MVHGKYGRAGRVFDDKEETGGLFEGEPQVSDSGVLTKPIRTPPAMAIRQTTPEPLMNLEGLSLLLDWRTFMLEEGKTRIYIYAGACNHILEMLVLL